MDEYGDLEGLVTLTDVLASIERFKHVPGIDGELPGQEQNGFNTVAGFVMYKLERIPFVAEHFDWDEFRFGVVDMDRNRIDKVLVARLALPD